MVSWGAPDDAATFFGSMTAEKTSAVKRALLKGIEMMEFGTDESLSRRKQTKNAEPMQDTKQDASKNAESELPQTPQVQRETGMLERCMRHPAFALSA